MEVYKEKTANDGREVLHFPKDRVFVYLKGNSDITITKSAISDMISDMNRDYETAGLFFGHSKNGKIVFDKYTKSHSVTRRGGMFVQKDFNGELQDLTDYAKEGFNAVIFVHLHPKHFSRIAILSFSMQESLNQNDKNVALTVSSQVSMKAGFVTAYEGVLTRTKEISNNPLFRFSIFDISKGAEQSEIFKVDASDEIEAERHKLSGLLRRLTRFSEYLKYEIDYLSKSTYTESTYTESTKMFPSSPEQIVKIINNKIINNMNLPISLKGRIKAVESPPGTYTITIKNPPGIFAGPTYKNRVEEVKNRILESVNAMFNA